MAQDEHDETKTGFTLGESSTPEAASDAIPKIDFDEIRLADVIQFVRDRSGVNIYVNWRALQVASVDKSTEVNVHLVDVSLEKALQMPAPLIVVTCASSSSRRSFERRVP